MRDIKFRGLTEAGKWVYGSLVSNQYPTYQNSTQIYNQEGFHVVLPESVGQFVGVQDRNCNDIYEGDIISWYEEEIDQPLAWIEWDPEDCKFYVNSNSVWGGYVSEFIYPKIEGNLIQNPELVK